MLYLMKTVDIQRVIINMLKSFFAQKKKPVTRTAKIVVKKPTEKNVSYRVNQKACEQYLLDKMIDAGMHNLTSKFHKKK